MDIKTYYELDDLYTLPPTDGEDVICINSSFQFRVELDSVYSSEVRANEFEVSHTKNGWRVEWENENGWDVGISVNGEKNAVKVILMKFGILEKVIPHGHEKVFKEILEGLREARREVQDRVRKSVSSKQ